MRAKIVRKIRRLVYGKGHHPGPVVLYHHPKLRGVIIADQDRRRHQALKKSYLRGDFTL